MLGVKGTYRNGVIELDGPLEVEDGDSVWVTPLPDRELLRPLEQIAVDENDTLGKLIERCQVNTGIGDLAHQHDHYLYGTPKRP